MIEPKHNEATLHVAAWLFARLRYGPVPTEYDEGHLYDEAAVALESDSPDLSLLVPVVRLFLASVDFAAVSNLVTTYAESCEITDNIRELEAA